MSTAVQKKKEFASTKERAAHELRSKIASFCGPGKNLEEVKARFKMSGVSAGAHLSWLRRHDVCRIEKIRGRGEVFVRTKTRVPTPRQIKKKYEQLWP
jgi:hypothetical protein